MLSFGTNLPKSMDCFDRSPPFVRTAFIALIEKTYDLRPEKALLNLLEITRYKTRFGHIIKTINCVEKDRLASMKYNG
jgi:hypothetical protein